MKENPSINSADIFGGEIQYFRLEKRFWKPILQQFKDTGLKNVTSYVQWGTHLVGPASAEHPAGELDFEGRTNPNLNLYHFLDLIQEMGLELNFRSGPFCCNEMEFGGYPKWLVCGDPSMMVWDHQNRTTQGYWITRKEGSQPSYLHPDYLDWCRKWITEVDKIIKPRLKSNGGFITMINLDNEVSYIVQDGMLSSDYNPVNVRPGGYYHQFLREKYGTASALPYAVKHAAIEEVQPPREVPVDITADAAWYLDWVEFKEWCMSRYLGELRAMHVANGVEDVTFMTNFNPHLPEGVPTRMPSFEQAVKGKDKGRGIVGYDFYRGTFLSWSGYSSMARVLRLMNASLDYTWSPEFMSGTWEKVLSTRVSDDHMRFMARSALAQGCKALSWFMFHDRRVWGDCPVSPHGHRRPSWEVLRETYALCTQSIPHWDQLQVEGDCAVIYDVVHHRHTSIGDVSPCNDGKSHVGAPVIRESLAGLASQEYYGLHRVTEAAGHQPLAVDIEARPERLSKVKLAFYPGSPIASAAGSARMREWVAAGGALVVSGPWPSLDELGRPLTFLGIGKPSSEETQIGSGIVIHRATLGMEDAEKESLEAIAWVRERVRSAGSWHVALELPSPVVWEAWGEDSGVTNAGGKLGGSALDRIQRTEESRVLASAVLQSGGGFPVLFVLNHYPEPAEMRVVFNTIRPLLLKNLVTGEEIPVVDGVCLVDIDRKAGEVFRVELPAT
jgi:beta-galactosidase